MTEEDISFEMRTTDRPNRFRVNPVNSFQLRKNGIDNNDINEEDTFNDEDIMLRNKRRSSR